MTMFRHALKAHKTFTPKTEKTVLIGGETDFCAERYGFRREINGISPSLCYKKLSPPVSCNKVFFTEYMPLNGLVAFATGNSQIYAWNPADRGSVKYIGMLTADTPCCHVRVVDGVNCNVFISGNQIAAVTPDGAVKPIGMSVKLLSTVMHCGRIFGVDYTDRYMLRWSGYALNDWTEGADGAGYARLNPRLGKLLELFVLDEKIIIVRECGVTALSTLGDARHMRLDVCDKHVLSGIYGNSSVICGGKLWIYTKKGMYVFDGNAFTKAPFDEIMLDYTLEQPKVVDERYVYYSAMKGGVKYLFEYDTETGAGNPFARYCNSQFFTENGAFCFLGSSVGDLLPDMDDPDRFWISKPFTFGAGKTAVLKSLTVEGKGKITVETDCDGRKLYADGAGKFSYSECGRSFTFKVTGNGSVTGMTAEWEVRG